MYQACRYPKGASQGTYASKDDVVYNATGIWYPVTNFTLCG